MCCDSDDGHGVCGYGKRRMAAIMVVRMVAVMRAETKTVMVAMVVMKETLTLMVVATMVAMW
jgi:hypothetical protein